MIRILLVGYVMGIRSERRLCEGVYLNLAYRWFCRLDLTGPVPDHSTFSKNRHGRFRDSDLLRHLFKTVVARSIAEGLASGQRFAAGASLIHAGANRQNSSAQAPWERQCETISLEDAPRAVRKYLATLDDAAFGAASQVKPKFTSHSDPASQWTGVQTLMLALRYSTYNIYGVSYGTTLGLEVMRSAPEGVRSVVLDSVSPCRRSRRVVRPSRCPTDMRSRGSGDRFAIV